MAKKISPWFLIFLTVQLMSCATYHVSTQSLIEQFANSSTEKKKIVLPIFPYTFFIDPVSGNDLKTIKCLDKSEQEKIIPVTNRTGIRITQINNSRTTFYFNTLLLKDSTITGSKTHFFNAQITPIKFTDISKIEIQK